MDSQTSSPLSDLPADLSSVSSPDASPVSSPDVAQTNAAPSAFPDDLACEETGDVMEALVPNALAEGAEDDGPTIGWGVTPPGLPIREGDWVMLQMMDGKKLSVRAGQGSRGTHYGELDLKPLVGMAYGTAARTRAGAPIYLLRPSLQDHIMTLKRITQIIYPKDIGVILLKLGIGAGSTVLECGSGSGALTLAFAWMVGPTGRVISYEREKAHHERAKYNLTRVGMMDRVTLKHRDMDQRRFDERGVEAAFLDVREPVDLLPQVTEALAPGGILGFLVPTTNQVSDVLRMLETAPYVDTEVMEIFTRKYKVNANRLRPDDRMIGHTGFLIFTRRIVPVEDFVGPEPRKPKSRNPAAPEVPVEDPVDDLGSPDGGLGDL